MCLDKLIRTFRADTVNRGKDSIGFYSQATEKSFKDTRLFLVGTMLGVLALYPFTLENSKKVKINETQLIPESVVLAGEITSQLLLAFMAFRANKLVGKSKERTELEKNYQAKSYIKNRN